MGCHILCHIDSYHLQFWCGKRKQHCLRELHASRHESTWGSRRRLQRNDYLINLIQNDLKIDVTNIRFHAVHRVGKPAVGKTRPIIARFVCREDRDLVWSRKKDLKNSTTYQDVCITQDYAKAIQQERRTLIKAMKKIQSTRIWFQSYWSTFFFVNEERFTCGTIPEHLKESSMETEITTQVNFCLMELCFYPKALFLVL